MLAEVHFMPVFGPTPVWQIIYARNRWDYWGHTVAQLSGGEKARLSLAQIAARTPKLLILDEITNNLDLETRGHVIEVLKNYPGAMIVISHEADFLKEIGINEAVNVGKFK